MGIVSEGYEDIFQTSANWIVVPVNTFGVAGAGLALEAKKRSPSWFYYYKRACRKKEFNIDSFAVAMPDDLPYGIITVATKNHWKELSELSRIEYILKKMLEVNERKPFHSIALPPIGCGRGELDYKNQVRPLFYQYLQNAPVDVFLCLPSSNRS